MQYHYTVIYDDKYDYWSVESDPSTYYPDGNVYDPNIFPGWFVPEEGSEVEQFDWKLYNTLQSLVANFPVMKEEVS